MTARSFSFSLFLGRLGGLGLLALAVLAATAPRAVADEDFLPVEQAFEYAVQADAHALFEEQQYLPLAQQILSRDSKHLAALGIALHMRHMPQPLGYI